MSQAELRIGTDLAGAYRGQRSGLGDYNEDSNREEGDQQEAQRRVLNVDRRTADEQEVVGMHQGRGRCRHRLVRQMMAAMALSGASVIAASCGGPAGSGTTDASPTVLRIGVGQVTATIPANGLRQLSQNLSTENLMRAGEDGRLQPWLAESWTAAPDGRSLTVKLRPGVKFHDGSPLDANAIADLLPAALRSFMGPMFSAVDHVRASGSDTVDIGFREAAPFLWETLEAQVQKREPRVAGTGPFVVEPDSETDMVANTDYYLGRSSIGRIHVESYPSVRAAWADLLRGRLDMLYEVGPEALRSMAGATNVSVFTFTRPYQHLIALNGEAPSLRRREIRRALNVAIDRAAIIREALGGQGVISSGPIWPRHWAFSSDFPAFQFDPQQVAALAPADVSHGSPTKAGAIRFTCLVPPDAVTERIALETKRQLASVGVDMIVEEVSQGALFQRIAKREYEAALIEAVSGPTLFRPYLFWHSGMPFNPGGLGNATVDAALDRLRHAASEDDYRKAAAGVQQAFMDDPPAIFLAWSVRARAVSTRFAVPHVEPGRDVLSTLRLWKPVTDSTRVNRN